MTSLPLTKSLQIPVGSEFPCSEVILCLFQLDPAAIHLLLHLLEHDVDSRIEEHCLQLGRARILRLLYLLYLRLHRQMGQF